MNKKMKKNRQKIVSWIRLDYYECHVISPSPPSTSSLDVNVASFCCNLGD